MASSWAPNRGLGALIFFVHWGRSGYWIIESMRLLKLVDIIDDWGLF